MQWKDPMNTSTWMKLGLHNLTKRRKRGRNVIGHQAIVGVPGQRGGNVTLCAAISNHGAVHHHANLGPYNTHQLLISLNHMRDALLGQQDEHPIYVVVWDNVSFYRALQVREWFNMNQGFINLCLPPYSPFLNPIEEFFSWRWKVYERQPYTRVNLLQAMGLACGDIGVEACQAWIRHARGFLPHCLARQNVACDVDEVLWPDPVRRHDAVAE
ncbi:uncharacterized protein LOC127650147 [Xyrauchen texanus]|uniref:uncharacterized protein LOC127650147 n=1 Tax=Xyrauchen texanus TaxID=154827 RepID=UPI002241A4A0|nr:uncharacterized protein LOC127650147 [Xyrauchen texanus]XP_051991323.1 uncharacterized protein LOC127650147 [Xyrauchen texanus]